MMKKHKGLFLKILLNEAAQNLKEEINPAFLQSLAKEEADAVLANLVDSTDLSPLFNQTSDVLKNWHYSWIHQLVEPFTPGDRTAFLSLLTNPKRTEIAKLFNLSKVPNDASPLLSRFYKFQLFPKLNLDPVLPVAYLPKSAFNRLLALEKNEFLKVLDFLGLYDLAHEMKHIVANKTLKDIYACLNQEQQLFLRQCLHAKDNVMTPNLHLEQWNGDRKVLMKLLHRRGISRMAIALSGQHPDLVWHVSHILDIGRGQLLQKSTQPSKVSTLTDAVGIQVENVLNTLAKRAQA